jgi:hypothetical protein
MTAQSRVIVDQAGSSAARVFGSIRLNSVTMRWASFGSSPIAWRTAAAIKVMISCGKRAEARRRIYAPRREDAALARAFSR